MLHNLCLPVSQQASNAHEHHGGGKNLTSKHLPFTNSHGVVDESSLPPIAGGGSQSNSKNFTNTNDSNRSNRSLQGQQLKSKKHKKFKSNYSQDATKKKSGEQVLRTYGLSGKSTLNSNSEFGKSDAKASGQKVGAGYNHPVSLSPTVFASNSDLIFICCLNIS